MRFMTFNLRFENDRDGDNAWVHRREQVVRLIRRYEPDILGTQEGRWVQLQFLEDGLPDYVLHAPDRVIDDTCQYPTLFVRKQAFDVVGGDEFWLSTAPRVHRSQDWDSAFPRMMSAAELTCRRTRKSLWAVVTHLDHKGQEARYRQASIVADWIAEREGPATVMGDFNDTPDSRAHRVLVSNRTRLQDTWQALDGDGTEAGFTHHGFDGVPQQTRMDWILVRPSLVVQDVRILRDNEDGRYPSDHFPYIADVAFRDSPGVEAGPDSVIVVRDSCS